MSKNEINTIKLTGQDSVDFANAIYRPTKEQAEESRSRMRRINEMISIERTEGGFRANIQDLDLGFLEK